MLTKIVNKCSPFTPNGDRIVKVLGRKYDEDLKINKVGVVNTFDIYEFIQASNSQTDLALLRKQMKEQGTIPVVSDEVVQDTSLFPQNIHELYDVVNSADKVYQQLPDSVKKIYPSKDLFLSALVDGSYTNTLVREFSKQQTISKDEVKKEGDLNE